jgi:hypothetical protein
MSFNINIKKIKSTNDLEIRNVVTEITYVISKELNGKTSSIEGLANLDFTILTEDNYIPLSGVTENIAKEWVLNCIGDRITSIEEYLDNELSPQEEQTRIVSTEINLPWETN